MISTIKRYGFVILLCSTLGVAQSSNFVWGKLSETEGMLERITNRTETVLCNYDLHSCRASYVISTESYQAYNKNATVSITCEGSLRHQDNLTVTKIGIALFSFDLNRYEYGAIPKAIFSKKQAIQIFDSISELLKDLTNLTYSKGNARHPNSGVDDGRRSFERDDFLGKGA
ncbi:MAG: hypothetical protein KDD48_00490 [Bdellovibrionales bacterium]|nr:hypothetical protein [Bdellovibrionales bacterium]